MHVWYEVMNSCTLPVSDQLLTPAPVCIKQLPLGFCAGSVYWQARLVLNGENDTPACKTWGKHGFHGEFNETISEGNGWHSKDPQR